MINLDLKIGLGRLSTVSLTQGISHGGVSVQERVKKLFGKEFSLLKVCRQISAGDALSFPGASALSAGREEENLGAAPGSTLQMVENEQPSCCKKAGVSSLS